MAHSSVRDAVAQAAAMPLDEFRPFRLLVIAPDEAATLEYDGARTVTRYAVPSGFMTSSSLDDAEARRRRSGEFTRRFSGRGGVTAEGLREFHASHAGGRGPFSVCMHRDGAQTVSHLYAHVRPEAVSVEYQDAAPCAADGARKYSVRIPRRS